MVFDSASPFQGVCLNDALEKGPNFTNSLFRCLLSWREEHIAVTGDILNMFDQIEMAEKDQKFHNTLAAGKFTIKAWNLNCAAIDKNPDEGEVDCLGHAWDKKKDTIKGKPKTLVLSDIELTKRNVLGLVMKLWDPFGFLLPVTMKDRMDLQAI